MDKDSFYQHFIWTIDFQLFEYKKIDTLDQTIKEVKEYLIKVPRWYLYEFKWIYRIIKNLDFEMTVRTLEQIALYFEEYSYDAKHNFLFELLAEIYFIHIINGISVDLTFFD